MTFALNYELQGNSHRVTIAGYLYVRANEVVVTRTSIFLKDSSELTLYAKSERTTVEIEK